MDRSSYHHGNLRAALIQASFDVLAKDGAAGFSVAKVARAVGVSTASPYRHFADRDHLLAAVAAEAALELNARMRDDVDAAGPDPVERFAATAGTYVRYVAERGAGLDIIFATPLRRLEDPALTGAGRALIAHLLDVAEATGATDPLLLLERSCVSAHGYATLHRSDFFTARRETTATVVAGWAVDASRALLGP